MNEDVEAFSTPPNLVWQIPLDPTKPDPIGNLLINCLFSETLIASSEGIIAKNAFVLAVEKHPTRNFFTFYKRYIGDIVLNPSETEIRKIERQDWMDKQEEDAEAELEAKASDPSSELEETLLETILGFRKI